MADSDVYLGSSLGASGPVNALEEYPLGASGPLGLSGDVDAPKFDVSDWAIIAGIGSIILMKQLF